MDYGCRKKNAWGFVALILLLVMSLCVPAVAEEEELQPVTASNEKVMGINNITLVGRYNSGVMNPDGGSAEIVAYNPETSHFYVVNGTKGTLDCVSIAQLTGKEAEVVPFEGEEIDVAALCAEDGFEYGDMTSVAVSSGLVAVTIQEADYAKTGKVALFSIDENGQLTLLALLDTGVQPDMVTFTPDGKKVLVANEGEPRLGTEGEDPAGSVTIITLHRADLAKSATQTVGFESFDEGRDILASTGVIIQKDTMPSTDFEPEYIVSADNKHAYVALQEANSIAVLDLDAGKYTGIYGLGFKDYGAPGNELDLLKDDTIDIKSQSGVYGIYMPDAISVYEVGGKTYLLTANEGDSRSDWEGLDNEVESTESPTGNVVMDEDVVWFDATRFDGLNPDNAYIFGGRSFSIYEYTGTGLSMVYDSGSDFERITAEALPAFFNCSNSKISLDNRSGKKGVEPETIIIGKQGEKTYAYIGLERIGGIMVYDVTDPAQAKFVNYINSRAFDEDIMGDVSPEGLCYVTAENSPTGNPLLLAACEVSGTVAVYEMSGR